MRMRPSTSQAETDASHTNAATSEFYTHSLLTMVTWPTSGACMGALTGAFIFLCSRLIKFNFPPTYIGYSAAIGAIAGGAIGVTHVMKNCLFEDFRPPNPITPLYVLGHYTMALCSGLGSLAEMEAQHQHTANRR